MKEENSLGTIIKEARKNKKLSQNALAINLDTTQQSIANWEKDKNKPDVSILIKLCEKLDLDYINIKESYYNNKKDNSKKFLKLKKRAIFITLISLFIICPIIMCLFIINRNKIYVYYGNINSDIITMSDTLFIETYDEYILQLGNITIGQDNYSKIRIYYQSQDLDETIMESNYEDNLYVIQEKKNSNLGKDFKIENVYIDIQSKDGKVYTSKMIFRNLYKYNGIFSSHVGAYF